METKIIFLNLICGGIILLLIYFLVIHTFTPEKNQISKHGFELSIVCFIVCVILWEIGKRLERKYKSLEKKE